MTTLGDVAARLRVELARLQTLNPFQVLELPHEAEPDAIRRAYLALVKRYHPARFARESAGTVDVANELFLLIRRAYTQLSDEARRRQWRERLASTTRPIHVNVPKAEPVRAQGTRPPHGPPPTEPPRPRPQPPPPANSVSPTTGRTEEQVRAMLAEVSTRGQRFAQALRFLAKGRYPEAKELLAKLATEDPQSRRYRQKLALAIGLEHRDAGRIEEALRELERAAGLEPEPGEATEALKKLQADRKGLFGKLFGR